MASWAETCSVRIIWDEFFWSVNLNTSTQLHRDDEKCECNSEYVKQFSLLQSNTAFACNGENEMGRVHFVSKTTKTTCKTGVSGWIGFPPLFIYSYVDVHYKLPVRLLRTEIVYRESFLLPKPMRGGVQIQWLITLISFSKSREALQVSSIGLYLYSKARWYISGERGCILMMPPKYLERGEDHDNDDGN
jgi:hypothetical protein